MMMIVCEYSTSHLEALLHLHEQFNLSVNLTVTYFCCKRCTQMVLVG